MTAAERLRRACSGDDEGSISLYMAIMAVGFIAILGLVVDGGAALSTRERAADLATQAARAGANSFTATSLRGGGNLAESNTATSAADRVVIDAGLSAAAAQVTVTGATVTVKVTVPKATVILSAVGLQDISQTATATATAVYGGTTQEGG